MKIFQGRSLKTQFYSWCGLYAVASSESIVENVMALSAVGIFFDSIVILTLAYISALLWRTLTSAFRKIKDRIYGK